MAEPTPEATVKVDVSEIVKAHISSAVCASLMKDSETLVRTFVDGALRARDKSDPYSSRERTILDKMTADLCQEVAKDTVRKYLEEMRPQFVAEVERRLKGKTKDIAAALADAFVGSLSREASIHLTLDRAR